MNTIDRMVVGLDIDGTITVAGEFFRMLTAAVYREGGKVIIVSARPDTRLARRETEIELRAFAAIRDTDTVDALLKRMRNLLSAVDFDFSSPGNSFSRNLLIEVSFHYCIRPYKRLLGMLEHDPTLVAEYHDVIVGLTAAMSGIKTRIMEEEKMKYLFEFDSEDYELAIMSDRITYVGIEETTRTFWNVPGWLLGRIKYG